MQGGALGSAETFKFSFKHATLNVGDSTLPVTGSRPKPKHALFDYAMQHYMKLYELVGGTLAVLKGSTLLLSRGYGYFDRRRTRPMPASAIVRLASLDKWLSKPAMKHLLQTQPQVAGIGTVTGDTDLYTLMAALGMNVPATSARPAKWNEVTIASLIDMESGLAGPPNYDALSQQLGRTPTAWDRLEWVLKQPLRPQPWDYYYDSFAYVILRLLVDRMTGPSTAPLGDNLIAYLKNQMSAVDVEVSKDHYTQRHPREPSWYGFSGPADTSLLGLESSLALSMSAPGFVRFMRDYDLNGGGGEYEGTRTFCHRHGSDVFVAMFFTSNTDPKTRYRIEPDLSLLCASTDWS
jgi:hypothetical protein